jgi:hypothetical protein
MDSINLLSRLKNAEDNLVERKTHSDSRDWLKTVVAFANSVPNGEFGILFIGVRNNGSIEDAVDWDNLQKTLNQKLASAYPPVTYSCQVVQDGERECLAVIVPGSPRRPHFAGPAYVRVGSETKNASAEEYDKLIAERHSKTYALLHAKGGRVKVKFQKEPADYWAVGYDKARVEWEVEHCDQFSVTLSAIGRGYRITIPLNRLDVSRDNSWNMMLVEIYER